jgi:hypothetical protein
VIAVCPWDNTSGPGTPFSNPASYALYSDHKNPTVRFDGSAVALSGQLLNEDDPENPYTYPAVGGQALSLTTGLGTVFSTPGTLPTNGVDATAAHPSLGYFVASDNNLVRTYSFSSTALSYTAVKTAPATVRAFGLRFNNAGNVIAIGGSISPGPAIFAYPFNTDGTLGTKYADVGTNQDGDYIYGVAFHPADTAVVAGVGTSPWVNAWVWDNSTGFGTKYSNPSSAISTTIQAFDVAFHPSGNAVFITTYSAPGIHAYSWSSGSGFGTKYSNPASALPLGAGRQLQCTRDGAAVVSFNQSGEVYAWPFSTATGFGTRYTNPTTLNSWLTGIALY